MLPHYRESFLGEHMGGKLVALLRRVFESNVRLTHGGRVLSGIEVKNLSDGKEVIPPEDVRAFLDAVREIGGWNTNPNFVALEEFLAEVVAIPTISEANVSCDEEAPLPSDAPRTEPVLELIGADKVLESKVPTPREPASKRVKAQRTAVRVAPAPRVVPTSAALPKSPPVVHPLVPGLVLQRDGFYWNPKWKLGTPRK